MKRFVILSLTLMMSVASWAQHLDFMGFPIEGTIEDFTERIRQRYPLKRKMGGDQYYIYQGTVCGHISYLKAEYSRKTKTVYKITVQPQHIDENAYVDSLVARYGRAEEIQGGYRWIKPGGEIFLYLPQGYDPVLMYFDVKGFEKYKAEKKR